MEGNGGEIEGEMVRRRRRERDGGLLGRGGGARGRRREEEQGKEGEESGSNPWSTPTVSVVWAQGRQEEHGRC